jgi:hypothetical protein
MADDTMKILQWPDQVAKLCITVCEPICAQSDYTIAIDIFDKPVASITVRGNTKFYACPDTAKPPALK